MTAFSSALRTGMLICGLGLLAACDTAEDRAAAFFAEGQTLMAEGKVDQAILEFRNALQLNQDAVEPRLEFAKALLIKRDFQGAVGNLLRVVELDPQNVDARLYLGRILLGAGQIEQAMPHVNVAYENASTNPEIRGLKAMGEYRLGNKEAALQIAQETLAGNPNDISSSMVLITERSDAEDYVGALKLVDDALSASPRESGLHLTKLRILEKQRDNAAIGAQLREMLRLFPENRTVADSLVRWNVSNGNTDNAEALLRQTAARFPRDRDAAMDVFRFLRQYRDNTAARDELVRLSESSPDRPFYLRVLSGFDFQLGDAEGAIKRMEELLATDLDTVERNESKLTLADLLRRTGATAEATTLFTEVLEEDSENVEGLRLRALNALDEDRPEDAISDLRAALNNDPQNAQLMTILATAHERNGSPGLALERLAQATKASSYATDEVIRYANFLNKEGQPENAETVLRDGINRRPDDSELLTALARLHLSQQNWKAAEEIAVRLERFGDAGMRTAQGIRVAAASGQQNFDLSIDMLRDMWSEGGVTTSAMENLVRTYVQSGQANKAVTFLEDILTEDSKNMRATLLLGAVRAIQGELDQAEALYRQVIADHPNLENGYTALSALLQRTGRLDEAEVVMNEGLKNAPGSTRLLLSQAARMELEGEFDGAIEIYDQLYEQNPNAELLANNLASLLSQHRTDPESQERAFAIGKRLRASKVPAFQDTYGWILYKQGEYDRALIALRQAVAGLPQNPQVNFHIGMTYAELGQIEDATRHLTVAVENAGPADAKLLVAAEAMLAEITQ